MGPGNRGPGNQHGVSTRPGDVHAREQAERQQPIRGADVGRVIPASDDAVRRTASDLWSLPLTAGGLLSGAPAPMVRDTSRSSYPTFSPSPDGRQLAFLTWRPGSPSDLWLMNLQTEVAAVMTPAKAVRTQ